MYRRAAYDYASGGIFRRYFFFCRGYERIENYRRTGRQVENATGVHCRAERTDVDNENRVGWGDVSRLNFEWRFSGRDFSTLAPFANRFAASVSDVKSRVSRPTNCRPIRVYVIGYGRVFYILTTRVCVGVHMAETENDDGRTRVYRKINYGVSKTNGISRGVSVINESSVRQCLIIKRYSVRKFNPTTRNSRGKTLSVHRGCTEINRRQFPVVSCARADASLLLL